MQLYVQKFFSWKFLDKHMRMHDTRTHVDVDKIIVLKNGKLLGFIPFSK